MNTLGDLLKETVSKNGSHPALGFVDESPYTYNELLCKVNEVMALLESKGIGKGDKVAILSSNQPNWGVAWFAVVSMGAVVVPILPDFHEEEIGNILMHSEAKALFVSESLYRKVEALDLPLLIHKFVVEQFASIPSNYDGQNDLLSLESSRVEGALPENTYPVDKDDLASIIYTSGTTGKSKGLCLRTITLYLQPKNRQKFTPSILRTVCFRYCPCRIPMKTPLRLFCLYCVALPFIICVNRLLLLFCSLPSRWCDLL